MVVKYNRVYVYSELSEVYVYGELSDIELKIS